MLHGRRPAGIYRWKQLHKLEERREREMVDNCELDYRIFCRTCYKDPLIQTFHEYGTKPGFEGMVYQKLKSLGHFRLLILKPGHSNVSFLKLFPLDAPSFGDTHAKPCLQLFTAPISSLPATRSLLIRTRSQ